MKGFWRSRLVSLIWILNYQILNIYLELILLSFMVPRSFSAGFVLCLFRHKSISGWTTIRLIHPNAPSVTPECSLIFQTNQFGVFPKQRHRQLNPTREAQTDGRQQRQRKDTAATRACSSWMAGCSDEAMNLLTDCQTKPHLSHEWTVNRSSHPQIN